MKEKMLNVVTIAGIVFQFMLVGFLCFMLYKNFTVTDTLNEMLLGVLTGLATGIGLSNLVSYATKEN